MPITINKNDGDSILTIRNFANVSIDLATPADSFSDITDDEEHAILLKITGPTMQMSFEYTLTEESSSVVSGTGGTVTSARGQMKYIFNTLKSVGTDAILDQYRVALEFDTTALDTGTASAGAATTLTDSSKSWTVNAYAGQIVKITGGTGSGQMRTIISNTATVLTIDNGDGTDEWSTTPDNTSTYSIIDGFERKGVITRAVCQMASDQPLTFRGNMTFQVGGVL